MAADPPPLAHLEWTLDWPWGARLLVVCIVLALLALSWWNLRPLSHIGQRLLLFSLRTALVSALFGVFMQPTWVEERQRQGGRVIAVVVDGSASMARGRRGQRRWDRAVAAAKALQARGGVQLFVGGGGVEAARGRALDGLVPDYPRTNLLAMLDELGDLKRPPGLGAVILISDGIDNAGETAQGEGANNDGAHEDRVSRVLARLGVPIHGVAIDDPQPLRDLAVTGLRASPHGFVRNVLPVAVELDLHGYETSAEQAQLVLRLDGVPVASKTVPLAGPTRRTVHLEVQPQRTGPHVLSAAVAPLADEATTINNSGHVTLRVLRDRTRVMHLAGHPSWDTRFLRTHLRADPAVDLISFYVMVGEGARFYVRAQDTTLIPFPTQELFEQALNDFDLVIFQDFQFRQFDIGKYLPLLHDFIRRGGGFAVLGGHQSLSAGGQEASSMANWLPVQLQAAAAESSYRDVRFGPRLTAAGRTHPVSRLAHGAADNDAAWARNPLPGHNSALVPRPDGLVLATSDDDTPLLAVADRGQGRVAVLATDGMWRWAFPDGDATDREATRADYHRLFEQLRGWLCHDPAYDGLTLQATQTVLEPGARAAVVAVARDGTGAPAAGIGLEYRHRQLTDANLSDVDLAPWQKLAAPTDAEGRARISWLPAASGALRLEVRGTIEGIQSRASLALAVQEAALEQRRLQPELRSLELLARISGGQVWQGAAPAGQIPISAAGEVPELTEQVRAELWSSPWTALLLLLLLTAEWLLRRRWGLA